MRSPMQSQGLASFAWAFACTSLVLFGSCTFQALDLTQHPCPCVDGWVCDPVQNLCVLPGATCGSDVCCVDDSSCADPRLSRCAPDSHQCVACLPESDNCGTGLYCLPSRDCAPGCKTNSDCTSPIAAQCDRSRHECVQCIQATDCPGGTFCSPAGFCVAGCAAAMPCAGGGSCCGGLCIDTTMDYLNCMGCGVSCGAGASCCGGTCSTLLGDPANCGQCGMSCLAGVHGAPGCAVGACKWTCDAGWGHCTTGNTGCETDLANTITSCGSCTTNCTTAIRNASTPSCAASKCNYATCAAGYQDCNNNRSDGCESRASSDDRHCGNCATDCESTILHANSAQCSNGACNYTSCNAGYKDCDGVRSNGCECSCGTIGKVCCAGSVCSTGMCMADGMCH